MGFLGLLAAMLIFIGTIHLRTYLQRRRWPQIKGTLDSVDMKVEATGGYDTVGVFVRPQFIHAVRYLFRGHSYVVKLTEYEIIAANPQLRVNPEKPTEAFLDNKSWGLPVLAITIGISLILLSIKIRAGGTNE